MSESSIISSENLSTTSEPSTVMSENTTTTVSEISTSAPEASSVFVLQTVPFDARFPNTNQTKNCYQNYTDYFKCVAAKGDDFTPCKQFKRNYNSLCPNEWISKYDEQRESGTFPASLEP